MRGADPGGQQPAGADGADLGSRASFAGGDVLRAGDPGRGQRLGEGAAEARPEPVRAEGLEDRIAHPRDPTRRPRVGRPQPAGSHKSHLARLPQRYPSRTKGVVMRGKAELLVALVAAAGLVASAGPALASGVGGESDEADHSSGTG